MMPTENVFIIPNARGAPGPEVYEWFRVNWGDGFSMRKFKDAPTGGYLGTLNAEVNSGQVKTRSGSIRSLSFYEEVASFHFRGEGTPGRDRRWVVTGPSKEDVERILAPMRERARAELEARIRREEELLGEAA